MPGRVIPGVASIRTEVNAGMSNGAIPSDTEGKEAWQAGVGKYDGTERTYCADCRRAAYRVRDGHVTSCRVRHALSPSTNQAQWNNHDIGSDTEEAWQQRRYGSMGAYTGPYRYPGP